MPSSWTGEERRYGQNTPQGRDFKNRDCCCRRETANIRRRKPERRRTGQTVSLPLPCISAPVAPGSSRALRNGARPSSTGSGQHVPSLLVRVPCTQWREAWTPSGSAPVSCTAPIRWSDEVPRRRFTLAFSSPAEHRPRLPHHFTCTSPRSTRLKTSPTLARPRTAFAAARARPA